LRHDIIGSQPVRFAETGMSSSYNGRLSPKVMDHTLSLHRLEKHDRRALGLAHKGGHSHIDNNTTGGDTLNPAHHPNAFVKFDHANVVVTAALGLSAHHSGSVDPTRAIGVFPGNRGPMTVGTQDSGKEMIGAAVITLGQQDFLVGECALESLVWSCGVLHLRSPSSGQASHKADL
jgi:hypothetical protein